MKQKERKEKKEEEEEKEVEKLIDQKKKKNARGHATNLIFLLNKILGQNMCWFWVTGVCHIYLKFMF